MNKNKDDRFSLTRTRNISIIAHIDAGKTTTTERILYHTRKIGWIGKGSTGSSEGKMHMDYMKMERERGITITSAATSVFYHHPHNKEIYRFNIIDTPGHVDFSIEVERSLRVIDGAVVIIDAKKGVEAQTEAVFREANSYAIPRIFFINKMDAVAADFFKSVETIQKKLAITPCVLQLPIGSEKNFTGIIDLITLKAFIFDRSEKENYKTLPLTAKELKIAQKWRFDLLEKVVIFDDLLIEKFFFDPKTITEVEFKVLVRKACLTANFFPILCGGSLANIGVKFLLEAIADYLPNPYDILNNKAFDEDSQKEFILKNDYKEPFLALVFKVLRFKHVGRLYFVRIYQGKISKGDYVYNNNLKKKARISGIFLLNASEREDMNVAYAGEIVALSGNDLDGSLTGHTFSAPDKKYFLQGIRFPKPVIRQNIFPRNSNVQRDLVEALDILRSEDPSFSWGVEQDSSKISIFGIGELHLETIRRRLIDEFNLEVDYGQPTVNYQETITQKVTITHEIKKQTGGPGQYAFVQIKFEPYTSAEDEKITKNQSRKSDIGFVFEHKIRGQKLKPIYIKAVEKGLIRALGKGLLYNSQVVNLKATLLDGKEHPVDSKDYVFEKAAEEAFLKIKRSAEPIILQPIMQLKIVCGYDPDDIETQILDKIIGSVNKLEGKVKETNISENSYFITAFIPQKNMFNYITDLRTVTAGRGNCNFTSFFSHYEPLSIEEQNKLLTPKAKL